MEPTQWTKASCAVPLIGTTLQALTRLEQRQAMERHLRLIVRLVPAVFQVHGQQACLEKEVLVQ